MSREASRFLVVGADGLVGASLTARLQAAGEYVTGTTRRKPGEAAANRVQLDLANQGATTLPAGFSVAFLCAAITGMAACEDDPAHTRRVNVDNTVALARRLLAAGTRIVFLSSNTVFDGTVAWPDEHAARSPANEYGRQKAAAEQALLSLSTPATPVAVVRLSKVLTPFSGMAAEFVRRLRAGEQCTAFDDLRLSPISLDYAANALLAAANSRAAGVFHVGGAEEMSYADFARRLATGLRAEPALVRPLSAVASGVRVTFRPAHPGLGMPRTQAQLGIAPEPTAQLMAELAAKE